MKNLISRQAAVNLIKEKWSLAHRRADKAWIEQDEKSEDIEYAVIYALEQCIDDLANLPSEQKWIPCNEMLPEDGKWVLATVSDIHRGYGIPDLEIVYKRSGISKEERLAMDDDNPRKRTYSFDDEGGNNKVAFGWYTYGLGSYFGQEVIAWKPLPEPYQMEVEIIK